MHDGLKIMIGAGATALMAWAVHGPMGQGKAFVTKSGEGWIAADIASGADKGDATARGQATISFYRGEPPPGVSHPGTTTET